MRKSDDLGEFGLIEHLKRWCGGRKDVVLGIGDDAAVLKFDRRHYQLFTTDMMVEDVHFLRTASARWIGHKALACNISDIAAMGGWPTSAVISIGIPSSLPVKYVSDIYAGMSALAKKFKLAMVGGDTVKADKLVISIALLGLVEKKNLVLRSGARSGDIIFVSGLLGNTLGSGKHLEFTPRVKEARWLVQGVKPTAMMDISDGLAGDIRHIMRASRVGARLDSSRIPLNPGATLDSALSGGEDFELLFTVPPGQKKKVLNCRSSLFYEIGVITSSADRLQIFYPDGGLKDCAAKAYQHF